MFDRCWCPACVKERFAEWLMTKRLSRCWCLICLRLDWAFFTDDPKGWFHRE